MTALIKLAEDPGFGNFKVAWLDQAGDIQTAVIPSVVGIGTVSDLSRLGLGRQKKATRPLNVAYDNISYLVGENVHRHTTPVEDLDYQRLSQGTVNRALTYAALGQAVNGRPTQAAVMLGFPVEVLKDGEQASAHLRTIRRWLVGTHRFTLDGREVEVEITQVKAAAQPVGAYLDWGMDATGEWVREIEALRRPVGVCDIGFNTIDLFSIEGGQIVDRETNGDDLGMHRVAQIVQEYLRENHGVDLSMQRSDGLLRDYLKTGRCLFYCADGDIDLAGLMQQAIEQVFSDIRKFIKRHWGNGRQFHTTIFAGGGGEALRPQLLRSYPTAYLPLDMVTSNVRGLLKRAQRVVK